MPRGFQVNLFAGDLDHARWMTVADNGDVLLAEPGPGRITLLRDSDGDGRADLKETFLRGLVRPHGLAIHDGYLYIGEPSRIVRVPYEPGDLRAGGNTETVGGNRSLGSGGGHWTRNIAFAPDRKTFYVAVGFWIKGSRTARVWGRPSGLAIAKDGSLLIADDVDQSVWRVSYLR